MLISTTSSVCFNRLRKASPEFHSRAGECNERTVSNTLSGSRVESPIVLLVASRSREFDTAVFCPALGTLANAIALAGSACHFIFAAVAAIFAAYAVE